MKYLKFKKKNTEEKNTEEREYRTILLKRSCIIAATIFILCGILLGSMIKDDGSIKAGTDITKVNDTGQKLLQLYVSHITKGGASRNDSQRINWWFNDLDGKYYVFLPAAADLDRLQLGLEGVKRIYIDNKRVKTGEKFSIQLGEHVVTTDYQEKYMVVFMKSSNIGSMFIDTESGSLDFVNKEKGNEESGEILIIDQNGMVQYLGNLERIKGRGNSWDLDKLSYQIKLSKKADLFEMGKAKRWNLIANYEDPTMLRNFITYHLAKNAGLAFSPDCVFTDIYINGEYLGTYLLTEKVEVDSERVNINNLEKNTQDVNPKTLLEDFPVFGSTEGITETIPNTAKGYEIEYDPNDITGGYLLEMDTAGRYLNASSGFVSMRNQAVVLREPEYASREQVAYIWYLYQEFEDAIYDSQGINPTTGKHYTEYIDVNSFAKKYLVEEITKNLDSTMSSQYLYKNSNDVSSKFYAGPVWDYDRALGNFPDIYGFDFGDPNGLTAMQPITTGTIWHALYNQPEFYQAVLDNYYNSFRPNIMKQLDTQIDQEAKLLQDSMIMNKLRWQVHGRTEQDILQQLYDENVTNLKDFLSKRIAFLDREWGS